MPEPRKSVHDVSVMKALAHPLRAALLEMLMAEGPRTASACATELGASPSNCSWHLRHLAELGLVEPATSGSGRERPWKASQIGIDIGVLGPDPATRTAQNAVLSAVIAQDDAATRRFLDQQDDIDPDWLAASGVDSFALLVTPEELRGLTARIQDLVRPYLREARDHTPDGAALAHLGLRFFPRRARDPESADRPPAPGR